MYHCIRTYEQGCLCSFFFVTGNWKQPVYPSIGECLNKLWDIRIMKYFEAVETDLPLYTLLI